MKNSSKQKNTTSAVQEQIYGQTSATISALRVESLQAATALQDQAFKQAISEVENVRAFVSTPENILGSDLTKHGEIAEQVEVGIRNAHSALTGEELTATFEGVGRLAPEDYLIDGIEIQSKFINGVNNNLKHVLEHMEKYPDFGRDGSYYHIPKDHHETIMKILEGDAPEGLKSSTIQAVKDKAEEISAETGKPFAEVVQPGMSKYSEIQKGTVSDTLDRHEQELSDKNQDIQDEINNNHGPSLAEAGQVAATAAAIGGTLSLGVGLYAKYKEGKNVFKGDLTSDDWKEIGLDAGRGAVGGAVSGLAIYGLTEYAGLSAPLAAAATGAIKGISSLVLDYRNGKITEEEFVDLGLVVCADSAIVGLSSLAGSVLIPIPIVGTLIGSLAGKLMADLVTGKEGELIAKRKQQMDAYINKLDMHTKAIISQIDAVYAKFEKLTDIAFDFERNNNILISSLELARAYGVKDEKLIKSHDELDSFILG